MSNTEIINQLTEILFELKGAQALLDVLTDSCFTSVKPENQKIKLNTRYHLFSDIFYLADKVVYDKITELDTLIANASSKALS